MDRLPRSGLTAVVSPDRNGFEADTAGRGGAAAKVLDVSDTRRLGLTAREAEVLSLVATGHTNWGDRREASYVSERGRASTSASPAGSTPRP